MRAGLHDKVAPKLKPGNDVDIHCILNRPRQLKIRPKVNTKSYIHSSNEAAACRAL